jgi:hypothetical protein
MLKFVTFEPRSPERRKGLLHRFSIDCVEIRVRGCLKVRFISVCVKTLVKGLLKGVIFHRLRRNPRKGLLKGDCSPPGSPLAAHCVGILSFGMAFLAEWHSVWNGLPFGIDFYSEWLRNNGVGWGVAEWGGGWGWVGVGGVVGWGWGSQGWGWGGGGDPPKGSAPCRSDKRAT